jgi:hypothetical protein
MKTLFRLVIMVIVAASIISFEHVTASPPAAPPAAQSRPALSGEAHTFDTEHFVIHYTFIGVDAVPLPSWTITTCLTGLRRGRRARNDLGS